MASTILGESAHAPDSLSDWDIEVTDDTGRTVFLMSAGEAATFGFDRARKGAMGLKGSAMTFVGVANTAVIVLAQALALNS